MPSDQRQTFRGYLHSVLVDGAKPFLYRSNVRTLLGVPEGEGSQPAFSPTPPPVGFKYTDGEIRFSPHLSGSATTLQDFPEREGAFYPAKDLASDLPGEGCQAVSAPDSRAWAEPDVLLNAAREDAQLDAVTSQTPFATQHEDGAALSADCSSPSVREPRVARPESAPTSSERTHVEIPGVSEKRSSFPALRSAKQDDDGHTQESGPGVAPQSSLHAAGGDGQPDAAIEQVGIGRELEARPRLEVAPAGSRRGLVKTSRPERAPGESDPGPPKALGRASFAAEESLPRPEGADQRHSQARPEARESISPSADAAARIEQLRHAVHQLAAKVSSQPARANDEMQPRQSEQTPPPPVQPIVVVNRPLVQRTAPCAFWERRYLGRSRLRTLR